MNPKERIALAELFHEATQNAIVDALRCYLQNVSGLYRYGRPSKGKRRKISDITHDIQWIAEKTETHLELINLLHMSNLQNGEGEHE